VGGVAVASGAALWRAKEGMAMPIYEYRCLTCGDVFAQFFRRFTDAPEREACPSCGSTETRRLFSTFTVAGRVDLGPGRAAWPTAWNDTNGGDPETLRYWRQRIEREARLEENYPELRDPARYGGAPAAADSPAGEHAHGHEHGHHHHAHPHEHAPQPPGPAAASPPAGMSATS
jgi:putative FmdB family regulatory protein